VRETLLCYEKLIAYIFFIELNFSNKFAFPFATPQSDNKK